MFNEITKKGVLAALDNPRQIDKKMVDAQQARRVLDRLVGYKISPLLWDKVRRGLSAGRVQSVALKLVCDREREIVAFVPEEYWNITARLAGPVPPEFDARLLKKDGANVKVTDQAQADAVLADVKPARWVVDSVTTKERKKSAVPPFITSKLQQASRFPVKKTMMIAQQLYEGVELPGEGAVGLITYMRTDSTRVSEQAHRPTCGELIAAAFGSRVRARQAERVQDEVRRAGRARGDPPDVDAVPPRRGARAPHAGSVLSLPADLEPLRRVADAAGDVRRHDGRHHRGAVHVPRQGLGARSSPGWMAVYNQPAAPVPEPRTSGWRPGPTPRTAEDDEEPSVLPALAKGDVLDAPRAEARTEVHAAAAALHAKRRWSRRSRRTASAVRPPTRRSSA